MNGQTGPSRSFIFPLWAEPYLHLARLQTTKQQIHEVSSRILGAVVPSGWTAQVTRGSLKVASRIYTTAEAFHPKWREAERIKAPQPLNWLANETMNLQTLLYLGPTRCT